VIIRCCVAALLLLPAAAFAQGDPGPFGGLFGRTPERAGRNYTLFEIRTSTSGQLDDQMLDPDGGIEDELGVIAGATVGAAFEHGSDRVQSRLRTSGTYQEFLQDRPVGGTSVETSGTLSWRVGTRLSIDASAAHLYSPFFQFQPTFFGGPAYLGVPVPAAPYVASLIASHSVDGKAGFTSYYSKHSTLSASFARRQTRFDRLPDQNFVMNGGEALWTRRVSRDVRLRLGYGREQIRQESRAGVEFVHETLEAGVDFARALSLSRRTTIAFDSQTSIIRRPGLGRQFRLNGGASLARWFGRSWMAGIHVKRATEFMPGFVEPMFSDTAGLSLMGLLSSRSELVLMLNGGRGEFGTDASLGKFVTANATTQVNFAVTRKFGFFAQHAFYHFEIPPGVSPVTSLDQLSRQTFTVGATAWIPLLNRERTPRDPR
jgi:hypothetical protein